MKNHKLDQVRPPRVELTHTVESNGAVVRREIPFVVGVLADLKGMLASSLPGIAERGFTEVDRENFNEVLAAHTPGLAIRVPNLLDEGAGPLEVALHFKRLDDFRPEGVVRQVGPLKACFETRCRFIELLEAVYSDDKLADLFLRLASNAAGSSTTGVLDTLEACALAGLLDRLVVVLRPGRAEAQSQGVREVVHELVMLRLSDDGPKRCNASTVITGRIEQLDALISAQCNEIIHSAAFRRLEAAWRGLYSLVSKTEVGPSLAVRLIHATKSELNDDTLFSKISKEGFGLLVVDHEFGLAPADLSLLETLASIAARVHAPMIAAASPGLVGLASWLDLTGPVALALRRQDCARRRLQLR